MSKGEKRAILGILIDTLSRQMSKTFCFSLVQSQAISPHAIAEPEVLIVPQSYTILNGRLSGLSSRSLLRIIDLIRTEATESTPKKNKSVVPDPIPAVIAIVISVMARNLRCSVLQPR